MNTELSLGNKRLLQALQDVIDNPSHHDQKTWHCNTTHCIAGFAECRYEMEKAGQENLATYLKTAVYGKGNMPLNPIINHTYFGISNSAWETITHAKNILPQLVFFVHSVIDNGGHIRIKECDISLADTDLRDADLSNARLSSIDLRDTDLSGANLKHADLSNADLSGANLKHADLSNADLSGANLKHADLSNADLSNADLSNADLSNADLKYTTRDGVKFVIH